jgi:pilus assembly protein FimV
VSFNKEKVMDAARKFVDKGQIDKAVKEYLRIVKEDPKDVRVWLKIGDLYAKQGSKQDASETYMKVARFYEDEGFAQKAVAVYKQILKIDPRLVDINLKLAELYRTAGLHSEAMQHFEAVAGHFHREGNTKEALATVRRVVELDPENIATRIKLAELYSKENMINEAVTEFTVACDQLRRQNRPDDFLKVAERLLWHKPDAHDLNRELAALYLQRNDARRALQKLQASFKANPRDVETLALLAQAFFALDQKAKTVSVLKELAKVHVENKARDKAADVYRKILEFVGNDAEALAFLGRGTSAVPAQVATPGRSRAGSPTPLATSPAQLAAAAAAVSANKPSFRLTAELPAVTGARMTGAMPLVDERTLAATDFALPDYDDADIDGNYSDALNDGTDGRGYAATDAQAEHHADEISKILAETDVYVKYGLHQKAIDHLRRVFVLDQSNVEARERLKDILISQGRDTEAQEELLRLAETVVPHDARRAEEYLRELFALNGAHTGAHELARRNRLRVGRLGTDGAVGTQSDEGQLNRAQSEDDFDPADFIPAQAHGSPAPGRPPAPPRDTIGQHTYDLALQEQVGHQTALTGMGSFQSDEFEFEDDVVGQAHRVQAVNAQLSDAELADEIDREVAAELAGYAVDDIDEDLPFDPDEARAFDAGVKQGQNGLAKAGRYRAPKTEVSPPFELGHPNYPSTNSGSSQARNQSDKSFNSVASTDPFAAELITSAELTPVARTIEDDLEEAEFYISQSMWSDAMLVLQMLHDKHPQNRLVASKLEEVEAMQSQESAPRGARPVEATESVEAGDLNARETGHGANERTLGSEARHGANERTLGSEARHGANERTLGSEAGHGANERTLGSEIGDATGADIYTTDARNPTQGQYGALRTEGIDLNEMDELDEIEEVDADVLDDDELPNDRERAKPGVLLENPVDDSDATTHYDLGLAYREMGLYDDAIKAFEKVLRTRSKEVQCRLMIGLCHRDQGNPAEGVNQFKQALHSPGMSELERQSLYYELAVTYDSLKDYEEALYYLEMILKKDPDFADAAQRATRLRPLLKK